MSPAPHLAVVGATGAVGREILEVLARRDIAIGRLSLFASARSAGQSLTFAGEDVPVQELKPGVFADIDLALFSAGTENALGFAREATGSDCLVVDNSNAFRADPDVPLIIPEINGEDLAQHRGLVANPNCTTIITLMALHPLHRAFGCRRVFASSYQAVSGSGAEGIAELERQVQQSLSGEPLETRVYSQPIAFNVLPQVDVVRPDGYTAEEAKIEDEGRRILHLPGFRASMTCVRVPVWRAHSVAVSAEFERPISLDAARAALHAAPGLEVMDDTASDVFPHPRALAHRDHCAVGRLRLDRAFDNGLAFWVCGDQLLKGAALNAVQIAEQLLR